MAILRKLLTSPFAARVIGVVPRARRNAAVRFPIARPRPPTADQPPPAVQPPTTASPPTAPAAPGTPVTSAAPAAVPMPARRPVAPAAAPVSLDPTAVPHYFGPVPNVAQSPLPVLDPAGRVLPGTGLRKFVDTLPGVGPTARNDLGGYLPVAVPDTVSYPGCDHYEIAVEEFHQQLHRDLPATRLRGYRQLNHGTDATGRNSVAPPERPHHLGPLIMAHRGRPVRITFVNRLPTGRAGELFLPVDTTLPGAGRGPLPGSAAYPQNRAVFHLAGAETDWTNAGNPLQWVTPAGEITPYRMGPALVDVPDMPSPGAGGTTFFFPNAQSARLLWFHDNTVGLTRLTVYSGQLGLYLLDDLAERQLVADGVLPADQLPLVIQDKTFVPDDSQLAAEDPTWDRERWGSRGSLWFPHVYQPRQDPYRPDGINPTGRWDYGPWCDTGPYPGTGTPSPTGPYPVVGTPPPAGARPPGGPGPEPVPNPYHDPVAAPTEPPLMPGTPHPSFVPAAYGDTMLVNGAAYPRLTVEPRAYRFRILNACNDRSLNLQLYRACSDAAMWRDDGTPDDLAAGEVPMVPAVPAADRPPGWPTDGRVGGVPDPAARGPALIQVGNECGLLPAPVLLTNQPIDYRRDRRDATVLNPQRWTLLLAPGERADVVVDFSAVPPGTNLILYNDCPAPLPAFDPRNDHHTRQPAGADPLATADEGGPATLPGYGPNTRTLLQIRVAGTPAEPFDLARLRARLPQAYAASQRPPIVPQPAYDPAFGTTTPRATRVPAHATSVTFVPHGGTAPVTLPVHPVSFGQVFEPRHGRLTGHVPAPPHPTEVLTATDPATPVGAPGDGTQLWRLRGEGRQSEAVQLGGGDVQLVNRVGRDGALRPPDGNELGWKETVRVDPGEDVVVALRPTVPPLPFTVADSVRPLDPTAPPGSTAGQTRYDFGWEYRWRSRLLGSSDGGLSRPLVLRVSPGAPTGLTVTPARGSVTALPAIVLTWTAAPLSRGGPAPIRGGPAPIRGGAAPIRGGAAPSRGDAPLPQGGAPPTRGGAAFPRGGAGDRDTGGRTAGSQDTGGRTAAVRHRLERAGDPAFTEGLTTVIIAGTATRYVDATVVPGVTYHYRIRAENAAGCSAWSHGVPAVVRLAAPTGLAAVIPPVAPLRVALRWANRSYATGVEVQRATNPTFSSGPASTLLGLTEQHLDETVAPETTYYFRVRTTCLGTASPWSPVVPLRTPPVPAAPLGLTALASAPTAGTATVGLSWDAESTGGAGAGFTVQRAVDAAFTEEPVTFTVTGRGFVNTGLVPGRVYHYRVRAYNVVGVSPFTPTVTVRTPG